MGKHETISPVQVLRRGHIERDYEDIDLRYLLRFICSYGAVFHFYLKHGTSLEKVYDFVVQNLYEPCGK